MVLIDSVYQKILALSNKEQRGYITPQEFNLFANKAQTEIFDAYFHNLKTSYVKPGSNMTHGDERDILEEKIHPFKTSTTFTQVEVSTGVFSDTITLPNELYLIEGLFRAEGEIVELDKSEVIYTESHPLTKANINRSVYTRDVPGGLKIYPRPLLSTSITLNYFKKPTKVKWGYVVIQDKALYNAVTSTNFEFHASEEEVLVSRILQLAGVVTMKPELIQMGVADQSAIKQDQND
tara:strand:- start:6965 stop:7672 length:708 start_codon:yes stop_codon:yes gene_type:complete